MWCMLLNTVQQLTRDLTLDGQGEILLPQAQALREGYPPKGSDPCGVMPGQKQCTRGGLCFIGVRSLSLQE